MRKSLKVLLRKNKLAMDSSEFNAQIAFSGNADMNYIVDRMQEEGMSVNRETALEIISHFQRKSAELVVSGFEVNTGLVNMHPLIKGPIHRHEWNPKINWIDVSVFPGRVLYKAINETMVEIISESNENTGETDPAAESPTLHGNASNYINSLLNAKETPACGIAFRTWLCKS
ncbi:MAG TPA: DNA-binding domain-containing protein [Paludibacter sp.]|nr:DNA-binding domain-containing protein [Paludibacter sp.]